MATIFQLKVQLQNISKPPIWRQIQVPEDINLYLLHCCIQGAMGWYNSHLHQFIIGGQYYGIPHPHDGFDVIDERKVKLKKVLNREKAYIDYEYDFGDGWVHRITLEKILPAVAKAVYPQLINGKSACPPEDCGGPWGYQNLKEALADPKHEEHEDLLEWVGDDFDPKEFDLAEHQEEMEAIYKMGLVDKGKTFEM